jgi:hypothetical protein
MRKKGPRDIPDFSRKKQPPSHGQPLDQQQKGAAPRKPQTPVVNVKPQATSSKSGRRGT